MMEENGKYSSSGNKHSLIISAKVENTTTAANMYFQRKSIAPLSWLIVTKNVFGVVMGIGPDCGSEESDGELGIVHGCEFRLVGWYQEEEKEPQQWAMV